MATKYLEYLFIWQWLLVTVELPESFLFLVYFSLWTLWNKNTSHSEFRFCSPMLTQGSLFYLYCVITKSWTYTKLFNGYFGRCLPLHWEVLLWFSNPFVTMPAGSSCSQLIWISWSSTTAEEHCRQTQTWSSRHRHVVPESRSCSLLVTWRRFQFCARLFRGKRTFPEFRPQVAYLPCNSRICGTLISTICMEVIRASVVVWADQSCD